MKIKYFIGGLFLLSFLFACEQENSSIVVVEKGRLLSAKSTGEAWVKEKDCLTFSGRHNELLANYQLGSGDFYLKARLALAEIDTSTALFVIGKNHFGFDSPQDGADRDTRGRFFTFSPKTGKVIRYGKTLDFLEPNVPFDFEVMGKGNEIITQVNGKEAIRVSKDSLWFPFVGGVGFRPWTNTMKIYDWKISGDWQAFPAMDYLFAGGELGYFCFRNPTMIGVGDTLIAFAQGRKKDCHDLGDRDLLIKRSFDGGQTWSKATLLLDGDKNAFTGPVPIVISATGRIVLLATLIEINYAADNPEKLGEKGRKIFQLYSDDRGATWSSPEDISAALFPSHWTSIASGPGSGIELKNGNNKGRLVAPFYHRDTSRHLISHVIYSDDGGESWTTGGIVAQPKVTECKVVELYNGDLMLNMRPSYGTPPFRQTAISKDGGLSWINQKIDSLSGDNYCMAGFLAIDQGRQIVFSNPASEYGLFGMTIKSSRDQGKTWQNQQLIHNGPAAYSDLIQLPNHQIGLFFEHGFVQPYEGLLLKRLTID